MSRLSDISDGYYGPAFSIRQQRICENVFIDTLGITMDTAHLIYQIGGAAATSMRSMSLNI